MSDDTSNRDAFTADFARALAGQKAERRRTRYRRKRFSDIQPVLIVNPTEEDK